MPRFFTPFSPDKLKKMKYIEWNQLSGHSIPFSFFWRRFFSPTYSNGDNPVQLPEFKSGGEISSQ
jgi:hypothetical protein